MTVTPKDHATPIPDDFTGLSFGMKALLPDKNGGHFFSSTNKPLVVLFQNLGISHLRLGGTTVESPPETPIPGNPEIDDLFAFVEAAHVRKVIYSLRLLETNSALNYSATNAAIAKYISDKYRPYLDCFALGNEPDLRRVFKQDPDITNFATYLAKWRAFAAAISNAVPGAKFAGPDGGSGNIRWTTNFAAKGREAGNVALITEHFYVGGAGRGIAPAQGIDDMLSTRWVTANENLYEKMAMPVLALGLPYRFTEANDHYTGGVTNASDTFAGALWALDFLHWWAAHGVSGVDFHNTQWVVNDVITLDSNHEPAANPKGYGLKAFEIGSHGSEEAVTISNLNGINLTAYAVHGETDDFVTLINKEISRSLDGVAAPATTVTIILPGKTKRASVMYLNAPNGNLAAKTGVTLGGATIGNREPWRAEWTPVPVDESGGCKINVPAISAAIVKFSAL